jgi:tripartite-type tricarboxylate transporter receptor subunit TctC
MKDIKSLLFKSSLLLFALSLVLAASAVTLFAAADTYPSKPVRFIVPIPPGSSTDLVGRLIATQLTERLGKQVIVENRGGAGGVIGSEMVAKAAPDGYTFLVIAGFYPINAAVYKLPFDPVKSFAPIAKLGSGPSLLVVHPSVPANSVKELIALAKQKPGQLIWATSGVGSNQHLGAELFKMMASIDVKIVQFKGGGPAMVDLLGGHSQIAISSISTPLPYIKSGKLKVLGTGGKKRSTLLPDVPTIAEAGLPGYEATGWWGILAPAGTPAPIVARMNKEIKEILNSDDVKKLFLSEGSEVDYLGPAEFGSYLEREITQWTRVVKEANIKVEQQ